MPTPRASRWFPVSLVALVVVRLVFIAHDEVRAFPFDESAYLGQAAGWYWKNPYNDWTYSRQPGYPLFLAVGSLLGIPARLCVEFLWIGVALLMVRVVGLGGVRRPLRMLLFATLLFHPFPTDLFCRAFSENLYTVALLVAVSALAVAITRRGRRDIVRWGLLSGVASAVAGITRQETVLVYLLIAFAGAIVLKMWLVNGLPRRIAVRRLVLGCLLPLSLAVAADHAVRAANYRRIGAYVSYDWSLPGFKALYRAMLSIPPEDPRLRVPIPRDVRERAAAASVMYARMLETMNNDPRCEMYRRHGERNTGIPGEYGSYNLWLMRDAAWILREGGFRDARAADEFFGGVAREIRDAQDRGALARRWAPLSFIPPEWGQMVTGVARAVPSCWRRMTQIGFARGEPFPVSEADRARFDAVALRRTALLREPAAGVSMHRARVVERFDAVKRGLAEALPVFTVVAMVLAIGGSIVAQFQRGRLPALWYTVTVMLWAAFVLRFLLAATLDATGVVTPNRYMFPSAMLLVPLGVLGLHAGVCLVRFRLRGISQKDTSLSTRGSHE